MKKETCKKGRKEKRGEEEGQKNLPWHSVPLDLCFHHNSFSAHISINSAYAAHSYRRIIAPPTDIRFGHVTCLAHSNMNGSDM